MRTKAYDLTSRRDLAEQRLSDYVCHSSGDAEIGENIREWLRGVVRENRLEEDVGEDEVSTLEQPSPLPQDGRISEPESRVDILQIGVADPVIDGKRARCCHHDSSFAMMVAATAGGTSRYPIDALSREGLGSQPLVSTAARANKLGKSAPIGTSRTRVSGW
jgi:hypothetical protein